MTTSRSSEQPVVRSNGSRWLALLVLVVIVGVGAAITVVATRDDDPASGSSAAQLSQIQASCRDWTNSSQSGLSNDQWCTNMFAWMSDQSGGSMMGSLMWQGPEQMGTACREWIHQNPADPQSSGKQRCDDMVDWMDGQMSSSGGNWMMQDR
jgi:hypothetical protein